MVRGLTMIEIFTDGASSGNPGPGGYGVILRSGKHYKELSEGFRKTTNNRMELLAVIKGLEALKSPIKGNHLFRFQICDRCHRKKMGTWLGQKGFTGKKKRTSGCAISNQQAA